MFFNFLFIYLGPCESDRRPFRIVVAKVVVLYVKMGPDNERQSVLGKVEFFYFN